MTVRVKLPGYYVDSLVLDASSSDIEVVNQNPAPNQTGVQTDTNIVLDLARTDGGGFPDTAFVTVLIQGVEAFRKVDGFQPGFDGPGSSVTDIGTNTRRFTFDLGSNFIGSEVVNIQVEYVAAPIGGNTYSFTIEDTAGPQLVAVQGRDKKVIRVTFNEPVRAAGDLNVADALTASNYSFERLSSPAVNVNAVSVSQVDEVDFDITTDIELTFGAPYRITLSNIEDGSGNPIAAPLNQAQFNAFTPEFPAGREYSLYRFLPQVVRDEDATGELLQFTATLQEVTNCILCDIDSWTDILDPDIAPEFAVDAMLCDLGNPFSFTEDLALADKRRLIRVLVDIYKSKGTASGIIDVIRFFLGLEVQIVELAAEGWALGEGELGVSTVLGPGTAFLRYSFEVVVDSILTDEQRQQIEDIVNFMKPAHTHLLRISEPEVPEVINHWELGLSELGENSLLH